MAGAFFLAAHTANYYSTTGMLDRGHCEINPILGECPSDKECLVYFSVTGLIGLGVAHIWKGARSWILWGYGAVNAYWTVHDRGLD